MRIGEAAKELGICVGTVRNYCRTGQLEYSLTPGGQRFFTSEQLRKFRESKGVLPSPDTSQPKAFYVRSSSGDKKLIQHQIDELTQAYGTPTKIYRDAGSGLNENRPGLNKLLEDVSKGCYNTVCATYEDRITRFGFKYIQKLVEQNGASITILHNREQYTLEKELMQDFMSLVASFSGRFYRIRGYREQHKLLEAANQELLAREGQSQNG